ncbi:MAG: hypothetical protein H7X94_09265, partial [Vallitaleaceae bacterium]|nr:hypothetical protein [Vallitaleaceae bacterium]
FEYYEGTNKLKKSIISFLTGKKFDGKEVIKDYSNGMIRLDIIIEYDEMGNPIPRVLYYTSNQVYYGSNQIDYPKDNYYQLELKE